MEFRDLLRRVVDNAPYLGLWVGRFVPNRRFLKRINDFWAVSSLPFRLYANALRM